MTRARRSKEEMGVLALPEEKSVRRAVDVASLRRSSTADIVVADVCPVEDAMCSQYSIRCTRSQ